MEHHLRVCKGNNAIADLLTDYQLSSVPNVPKDQLVTKDMPILWGGLWPLAGKSYDKSMTHS